MITLAKEGITATVSTEFEAAVFLRRGYKRVGDDQPKATVEAVVTEEAQAEAPEAVEKVTAEPEKPKRRRRTAKQAG